MEDMNACPMYDLPEPTETPICVSPTPTPTNTSTPTCPITTQYLEVELQENTKFKLILWNQPNFTSPATANCDYVISGVAYGSLGTIFYGEETILSGEHQHQFNLAPILQPGEIVVSFDVLSYTLNGCPCPVNLILPIQPTPTNTSTPTPTVTPSITPTQTPTVTPASYPVIFVSSGETFEDLCDNPQSIPTLYSPQPFFTDTQQLYYDSALTQYIDYVSEPFFASTGGTQLYAYTFAGAGLSTYGFTC